MEFEYILFFVWVPICMSSYIFHVGIIKRKSFFFIFSPNVAAAAVGLFPFSICMHQHLDGPLSDA